MYDSNAMREVSHVAWRLVPHTRAHEVQTTNKKLRIRAVVARMHARVRITFPSYLSV